MYKCLYKKPFRLNKTVTSRSLYILIVIITLMLSIQCVCKAEDRADIVTVDDNLTRVIFNNKSSDFKAGETIETRVKIPRTGRYAIYTGPASIQTKMKIELVDGLGQTLVDSEVSVRSAKIQRVQPDDNQALVLELKKDMEYTLNLTAISDVNMKYFDFRCLDFDINNEGGVISPLDYISVKSSTDKEGNIINYTVPNTPTSWSKELWPVAPRILGDYLDIAKLGDTIYGFATATRGATTEYSMNFKEDGIYKITLLSQYAPQIAADDVLNNNGAGLFIDGNLIGRKKYQNTVKDKKKVASPSQSMEFETMNIAKGEHILKLEVQLHLNVHYIKIEKLNDGGNIESAKRFSDVHDIDHWSCEAVDYVYSKGFMNGVSDELFVPDGNLTRAMFVTVIYRMEGQPEINTDSNFSDVEKNSYYEKAVIWAKKNNIVNGVSESIFNPSGEITREQMATMLYRYALFKGLDINADDTDILFQDAYEISEYANIPLKWVVKNDIFPALNENYIKAKENATRGQAAFAFMKVATKFE